jgi:nucleoside 2-deoxyribosyltransferase
MKKKIYLCGPISGLTLTEANARRLEFMELFPSDLVRLVDPLRGKYRADDGKPIGSSGFSRNGFNDKSIVKRDRNDVLTCDLVLADFRNSKKVSIGSMVEFGWADAMGIPIITVMDEGDFHDHAFVHQLSTHVVDDPEDAAYLSLLLLNT